MRSYDGSGNNLTAPSIAAVNARLIRIAANDYDDGVSALRQTGSSGALLASARVVSNAVLDQRQIDLPNQWGTSDWIWQWGQFIDHDLSLSDGIEEQADIALPSGDILDDGSGVIPFRRAAYDHASGTGPGDPRQQINQISGWIDGSNVYGSSLARANELRTFSAGTLKTSPGNLLPFNVHGFPNANGPAPDPTALFLAGDVRANEQVGLTVIHTLFMREHNRLAVIVARRHPNFSDEEIFQVTRRLVGAEIEIITYNEFLPALLGKKFRSYAGYDAGVNGGIRNEFSVAAYRFGHSALSSILRRVDASGDSVGDLSLRDVFFNAPALLTSADSLDPILRGLSIQRHQTIDAKVVDDLRNFLFGPPGEGGLDLASLNIQRGRDHGVPSLNDVRAALGLSRHPSLDDITSDPQLQAALAGAYASIDDVDFWVGGLAEDPFKASQLGQTFSKLVSLQFHALRDGDRFWYQNNLRSEELSLVQRVRLSDVIRSNSGAQVQDDVFFVGAAPRDFAEEADDEYDQ